MNDLDLRVSEKLGWKLDESKPAAWVKYEDGIAVNFYPGKEPPPWSSLPAWFGALIEEFQLCVDWFVSADETVCIVDWIPPHGHPSAAKQGRDQSLGKAICLAVLEINNE